KYLLRESDYSVPLIIHVNDSDFFPIATTPFKIDSDNCYHYIFLIPEFLFHFFFCMPQLNLQFNDIMIMPEHLSSKEEVEIHLRNSTKDIRIANNAKKYIK
ncbi:hypothetical protein, partial [Enterobacter cloacae]|uniref:hypothetical protein n=1 Tax=Enterobacter cloacae TaxID=550 RepID=UPI001F418A98